MCLGPIGPGAVEYTVQTAASLGPSSIDFLSVFADTVDVLIFESIVASTRGSEQPSPVTTTRGSEIYQIRLDGTSAVGTFASEPIAATWILQKDATVQELTLENIDLSILVAGLDIDLSTEGPNANRTWDMGPPSLTEMP